MKNKEIEQAIDLIDSYLFGTANYHDYQLKKIKDYIIRLEKENLRLATQNRHLQEWREKMFKNI